MIHSWVGEDLRELWGELQKMHSGFPDANWALHLNSQLKIMSR